ncbi:hypothetical protein K9L97_04645 [Candidatus Woesearchaeota archaeon]|nr:hypothetical protein [Candidatus Woesearchaeota archaeon]
MNNYETLIEGAGLTRNEAIIYTTLLKIGKSKTGEIVREAKISGGKIYETLYKLADKGLVKTVIENNVKYFIANNPETILTYMKEKEFELRKKEKELKEILPELKKIQKMDEKLQTVSLIIGIKGVQPLMNELLEGADKILIMGVRSGKNNIFNNFWKKWHKERVSKKIDAKMIFSDKGSEYWKFYKRLKHTEVKEITYLSPSATTIIDDNVLISNYDKELTMIHIKSEAIARSFEGFFQQMWKMSP